MTSISKKIVFFGNERLSTGFSPNGAPTLQALIDAGYAVVAVVANHQEAQSRKARRLEVQAVAKANNIPVLLPTKLGDIHDHLASLQPDIGVLVAYGRMVPQSIIDIFPHGIVNIHPSLLPKYRGSTPIEQAMLDGTAQTGVSLMQLVKAMDAGPVFDQTVVNLDGSEDKHDLTQKLLALGGEMLLQNLPQILDGSLKPVQQQGEPTFCSLIKKEDGLIDPTKLAVQLEREIRAFAGWPKSRLTLFGHDVIVTKAQVASALDEGLLLSCANNSWLAITELIAPSGKKMSGVDFKRGYSKT